SKQDLSARHESAARAKINTATPSPRELRPAKSAPAKAECAAAASRAASGANAPVAPVAALRRRCLLDRRLLHERPQEAACAPRKPRCRICPHRPIAGLAVSTVPEKAASRPHKNAVAGRFLLR